MTEPVTRRVEEIPFGAISMHDAHLTVSTDAGPVASFELHVRGPHRIVAAASVTWPRGWWQR